MARFKIGDQVRNIYAGSDSHVETGAVGTVTHVYEERGRCREAYNVDFMDKGLFTVSGDWLSSLVINVVPGTIFGYALETDDFTVGGLSGEMAFDVLLGSTHAERKVVRYCINIHKYRDQITEAINTVTLMGIPVERITIIEGEVQAHPPAPFHWCCPFCYPNNVGSQEYP